MKIYHLNIIIIAFMLILSGLLFTNTYAAAAGSLDVFVSIPPQAYFVSRIGEGYVRVHTLVGAGQNPHTYEPSPRQMMALGRAKLYFKLDVEFERELLKKIKGAHRQLPFINTA